MDIMVADSKSDEANNGKGKNRYHERRPKNRYNSPYGGYRKPNHNGNQHGSTKPYAEEQQSHKTPANYYTPKSMASAKFRKA